MILVGRVDSNRVVKVADFGLARFTEEKEYYRPIDRTRALPLKWMAIESMTEEIFTTKSDVVSTVAMQDVSRIRRTDSCVIAITMH